MTVFCAILAMLTFVGAMAEARPAAAPVATMAWRERVTLTACTFGLCFLVAAIGAAWWVTR